MPSPHNPHRAADERGPDCLAEVLRDFLTLDLKALTRAELDAWLVTVTACLTVYVEHDGRNVGTSLGAANWVQAVANRLTQAFPANPRLIVRWKP
jgi:hypothetical protein